MVGMYRSFYENRFLFNYLLLPVDKGSSGATAGRKGGRERGARFLFVEDAEKKESCYFRKCSILFLCLLPKKTPDSPCHASGMKALMPRVMNIATCHLL